MPSSDAISNRLIYVAAQPFVSQLIVHRGIDSTFRVPQSKPTLLLKSSTALLFPYSAGQ